PESKAGRGLLVLVLELAVIAGGGSLGAGGFSSGGSPTGFGTTPSWGPVPNCPLEGTVETGPATNAEKSCHAAWASRPQAVAGSCDQLPMLCLCPNFWRDPIMTRSAIRLLACVAISFGDPGRVAARSSHAIFTQRQTSGSPRPRRDPITVAWPLVRADAAEVA